MTTTPLTTSPGIVLPSHTPRATRLDRLGPAGRLSAYREGELDHREREIWAAQYPEEVPTVNGEVEWIGLTLADRSRRTGDACCRGQRPRRAPKCLHSAAERVLGTR